ncbi:MAG: FecR family protein [Chitinophagaceae bacterium]
MPESMELDRLILKYLSETLTEPEEEYLFRWRDASLRNRETFERLTSKEWLAGALEQMNASGEAAAWERLLALEKASSGKLIPFRRRFLSVAAAAVLFICIGTGIWWFTRPVEKHQLAQEERFRNDVPPGKEGAYLTLANGNKVLLDSMGNGLLKGQSEAGIRKDGGQLTYEAVVGEIVQHTLSTPKGRKFRLVLADGTVVWLNAESSITFPTAFVGKSREVSISGEAYFEVTKTGKPFFAHMDGMKVEVLGTRFNMVNYGNDAIKTTLVEGSVQVEAREGNDLIVTQLVPGSEMVLENEKLNVRDADIEGTLAWTNDLFAFNDADIKQVMRQLERWYDIEVIYEEKVEKHFTGTIPMNVNISTVLKVLELTKGVKFMVEGRKVTVMGN